MISLIMKSSNVSSMSISKSSIPYYYNGLEFHSLFQHKLFRRELRWMKGKLVSTQYSKSREISDI